MKISSIHMQEADGSPGNGAAQPAQEPVESQAQGTAQPDIGKVVSDALREQRDSIFAELRRNGVIGKEKSKSVEPKSAPSESPNLRQFDRAFARNTRASHLTDAAVARLERLYVVEQPDDANQWLSEVLDGMGVGTTQAAQSANHAPAPTRSASPVSDGGTPPAPKAPLEERDLLSLSPADRDHIIKQKGVKWYLSKLTEQNKGKQFPIKR
jgi:hypothetical protein